MPASTLACNSIACFSLL